MSKKAFSTLKITDDIDRYMVVDASAELNRYEVEVKQFFTDMKPLVIDITHDNEDFYEDPDVVNIDTPEGLKFLEDEKILKNELNDWAGYKLGDRTKEQLDDARENEDLIHSLIRDNINEYGVKVLSKRKVAKQITMEGNNIYDLIFETLRVMDITNPNMTDTEFIYGLDEAFKTKYFGLTTGHLHQIKVRMHKKMAGLITAKNNYQIKLQNNLEAIDDIFKKKITEWLVNMPVMSVDELRQCNTCSIILQQSSAYFIRLRTEKKGFLLLEKYFTVVEATAINK